MKLIGVCIYTDNAKRLAEFYKIVLQEEPFQEEQHYGFKKSQIAVYNPGNIKVAQDKNMSLMFVVPDLIMEYKRLIQCFPELTIVAPPERKPWGAFSFLFADLDGNIISFVEGPEK
ncbi:VOC family protein [Enterococcus sp. HY326]|uniref:VOC family protein n=1 Tax=Enterococcus sp. HY326 TaxID=2971265 RepID=UPI002240D672|nr:VOC family protein [Enterococcus sp. HY326]